MACRNPVRVVGTSVESWLSCVIFSYSSHWIVVHWKIFSTLWFALVSQLRGLSMGHVTCNMGLKTCISVCVLGRLVCFSYFLAHSVSLYKNHFFFIADEQCVLVLMGHSGRSAERSSSPVSQTTGSDSNLGRGVWEKEKKSTSIWLSWWVRSNYATGSGKWFWRDRYSGDLGEKAACRASWSERYQRYPYLTRHIG